MPYELEEQSSRKFLNGTQIAILLSLGLHLLAYKYGFPVLLFQRQSSNPESVVSTIELTPVEQSRLPNLESQWNIPNFNTTSLDEAAPPFALPLPPNFSRNGNLPPIPIPPGYRLPSIPNIGSDIKLPPLGITNLSALPLPPPLPDIDSIQPPDVPLTTPEQTPEENPAEAETPVAPTAPKDDSAQTEDTEDRLTPEQIAAVRKQKLTGNLRDVSRSLRKQNVGTTNEEARKNYVAWLSKIEEVEPESLDITGIYPKDACIRRLEGASVYGVLVDTDSQVVGLELIKGAEYPIFNEQASKNIQEYEEFDNDTEEIKPYQVTVNYQYDAEICPSLTLPSLRKKEATPPVEKPPANTPEAESETTPEEPTEANTPEAETETIPEEPTEANTPEAESETAPEEPTEIDTPEAESETTPEKPTEADTPEAETQPSLRERLQDTPLPNDNNIRDRLRQNPLPK